MWWCITTHFGYRARDESRKLCFGDIRLCTNTDGKRYLEWDTERGTKTRTGENSTSHQRSFNPKAFQTNILLNTTDQLKVGTMTLLFSWQPFLLHTLKTKYGTTPDHLVKINLVKYYQRPQNYWIMTILYLETKFQIIQPGKRLYQNFLTTTSALCMFHN